MEEKNIYTIKLNVYCMVEADTVEEAFHIFFNNASDAIHYIGDRPNFQTAKVTIGGEEDELSASMIAEWKKGVLNHIGTDREVF